MLRAWALLLLICWSTTAAADSRQFPYQAMVVAEGVEVRCGPGQRFYVTSLLARDQRVIVHRHDHGGWYMIAPPEGSFSYVEASLIRQTASDRGVVHLPPIDGRPPARAIVWIGSTLGDEHSAYGRELSHGDEIKILGRATLPTRSGPVDMFKIVPPPQEFRWVKGDFVVPLDEQHRLAAASDPYQVPPSLRPQYVAQREAEDKLPRTALTAPAGESTESLPDSPVAPSTSPREDAFLQLDAIDERYAAMMQADPIQWDLDEIDHSYRELQRTAPDPLPVLIEQRLSAIAARREIAARYERFVQLTAATSQRDAQLASMQERLRPETGMDPGGFLPAAVGETGFDGSQIVAPWDGQTVPGVELGMTQSFDPSAPSLPALPAPADASSALSPPQAGSLDPAVAGPDVPADVHPRLSGAGIVQTVYPPSPGLPAYRLVAPDGRLLAFLDPERHAPLQEWVGAAAGVIGRRFRDPRLGADVIRVQRVVPVQLTQ